MKSSNATQVRQALRKVADPKRAKSSAWFFKTGKGQYGEGDKFIGVTVPAQRLVARKHTQLPLTEITKLLQSPVHEHRLTALIILVAKAKIEPREIAEYYLSNTKYINNWDLVDTSASYILGPVIDKKILYKLAKSDNLWERRIAILAAGYGIRQGDFDATIKIAEMLMQDKHDLIHKATGWMLREVGKKDIKVLELFLNKYASRMPRTMLRYAIERLPSAKRNKYLKAKK